MPKRALILHCILSATVLLGNTGTGTAITNFDVSANSPLYWHTQRPSCPNNTKNLHFQSGAIYRAPAFSYTQKINKEYANYLQSIPPFNTIPTSQYKTQKTEIALAPSINQAKTIKNCTI